MNVLPLVFSFIALLTILTYTRLSGFVVSKAIHHEYEQFITTYQEDIQRKGALAQYKENGKKEKNAASENRKGGGVRANRCLNIYPLLDPSLSSTSHTKISEAKWIFKNLILLLFSESKFYKVASDENPKVIDELIDGIQTAAKNYYEKKQKAITSREFPTLELSEPRLQLLFYKIFKDPEGILDEEDEEYILSKMGSRSLLELIKIDQKTKEQPLRVYLADPTLLLAVFQDKKIVDEIILTRKKYYDQVKKDPTRKEVLSEEFESQFLSKVPSQIQLTSLNWKISGTDPTPKKNNPKKES